MEQFEQDQIPEASGEFQEHTPEEPVTPQPEAPAAEAEPVCTEYSGTGVGRRETPFLQETQSGYYGNQNTYQRQVPPKAEPVKKAVKKRKKAPAGKRIVAAVLALTVLAGSCGVTAALVNRRWEERATQMESTFNQRFEELQKQISTTRVPSGSVGGTSATDALTPSQVYEQNVPSVVQVTCQVLTASYFGQATMGTSVGSGFILTENGYIVTNYHVIEGASSVSITTYLGEEYEAQVVGYEATNDVAVLKVEGENMPAVNIGSSSDLVVGDQVVAIGNALGELTGTMTVGYVSAKDRSVTTDNTIINMIQTDAAINSGNSGGPLFNMYGQVVGITTAKYSGESNSGATIEGIGFAIPIDDVLSMVEDLVNLGYITGAYLGVGVNDVDSAAQYYGIPAGAYVAEVNQGSCAEEAGIQVGDIIVALGEHTVDSYTSLKTALRQFKAGDTTTVTVYRSGQTMNLEITLDEKPQTDTTDGDSQDMPENGSYEEWYNYFHGEGNN